MKKFIVHEMLAIGFTMAQLFAPPIDLSEEVVERLHSEARHKSEALQRTLDNVYDLEERQGLVDQTIGFIVLSDVTNLSPELISAIISEQYFLKLRPTQDVRGITERFNFIDPNRLIYITMPSDEMDAILRRALKGVTHPSVSWDDPLDEDGTTAYDLYEKMGPFTEMFLCACQDTSIPLPSFIEGTPKPQWMPTNPSRLPDGQPNKEFFIKWWKNIRYGFIETEGFAICYLFFKDKLKPTLGILKSGQSVDNVQEFVAGLTETLKLRKRIPQMNGLVNMGLDALMKNWIKKYPDLINKLGPIADELQKQINTAPGQ